MVGMGEERKEIIKIMEDMRYDDVDLMNIGKYIKKKRKNNKVIRLVKKDELKYLEKIGKKKGLMMVD